MGGVSLRMGGAKAGEAKKTQQLEAYSLQSQHSEMQVLSLTSVLMGGMVDLPKQDPISLSIYTFDKIFT
jgi:hypothetical protein